MANTAKPFGLCSLTGIRLLTPAYLVIFLYIIIIVWYNFYRYLVLKRSNLKLSQVQNIFKNKC